MKLAPHGQSFPYKLARLVLGKERSYIVYYVWHLEEDRLKRVRDYAIERIPKAERKKVGQRLVNEINYLLISGHIILGDESTSEEKPSTFMEAFDKVLAYKKRTIEYGSYRYYKALRGIVVEYLEGEDIALKTFFNEHYQKFMDFVLKRKIANKTYNNYLGCMHAVGEELVRRKLITENSFSKVPKLAVISGKHFIFERDDMIKILNHSKAHDFPLFVYINFLYFTFARPRSVKALRIRDVKETVRIDASTQKTKSTYYTYVSDQLRSVINELEVDNYQPDWFLFGKNGTPGPTESGRDFFYNRHVRALRHLELHGRGYDQYSWKHTGVVALWKQTQDIELISRQCGHFPNIQTTLIYLRQLGVDYANLSKKIKHFSW